MIGVQFALNKGCKGWVLHFFRCTIIAWRTAEASLLGSAWRKADAVRSGLVWWYQAAPFVSGVPLVSAESILLCVRRTKDRTVDLGYGQNKKFALLQALWISSCITFFFFFFLFVNPCFCYPGMSFSLTKSSPRQPTSVNPSTPISSFAASVAKFGISDTVT